MTLRSVSRVAADADVRIELLEYPHRSAHAFQCDVLGVKHCLPTRAAPNLFASNSAFPSRDC